MPEFKIRLYVKSIKTLAGTREAEHERFGRVAPAYPIHVKIEGKGDYSFPEDARARARKTTKDGNSLQRVKCYTLDLTELDGSGDIQCPKCGSIIFPDDEMEDTYTIVETVMKEGNLDKMILKCNKCQTGICLTGFQLLDKLRGAHAPKPARKKQGLRHQEFQCP